MKTIYLRFPDRNAALARLEAILGHELDPEGGMLPTSGHWQDARYDVDDVGVIHAPVPPDADENAVPEAMPGWHVNLLWWGDEGKAGPDFGADVVLPLTPSRVFAT